jgi:ABC-type glycerol-3-phosphate transport system substrate-binding protein
MYRSWWNYAESGALTLSAANQLALFLQGKAVFDFDGTWDLGTIQKASASHFQFAVVPFPSMAKEQISVGGSGDAYWPGGCSDLYAVTSQANKKSDLALTVDFLRYITAPQNAQTFVQEEANALPAEIGASPASVMLLAEPKANQHFLYTQFTETDEGPRVPIFQQWLSDQQDVNTTIDALATLEDQFNAQQ